MCIVTALSQLEIALPSSSFAYLPAVASQPPFRADLPFGFPMVFLLLCVCLGQREAERELAGLKGHFVSGVLNDKGSGLGSAELH